MSVIHQVMHSQQKDAGIDFIYAAYGFGEVSDKDYIAKIDSFGELKNILL